MKKIITLVTDFGNCDSFVASMKGVILSQNQDAEIIDVTHQLNPFDLKQTAFLVSNYYKYFPNDTIHVIVVDPGVGSERRPLIVKTKKYIFIAPDNGILTYIYESSQIEDIINISITNDRFFNGAISRTFHGRDIFVKTAAWLSLGVKPCEMGHPIDDMITLTLPRAKAICNKLIGEIIYIDGFGNSITNINEELFEKKVEMGDNYKIFFKDIIIDKISNSYSMIKKGSYGAIFSSEGYLELFSNQGNFAKDKNTFIGNKITIQYKEKKGNDKT